VIAFPRFTHPRAGLSNAQWHALSSDEKIERLLNMPLHRAAEILTWPVAELDPLRRSLWMQVWRVVFMVGVKALFDGQARPRSYPRARPAGAPSKNSRCANSAPVTRHRIVRGKPGRVPGGGVKILVRGPGISRQNWKSVGRTILRRSVLIVLPCIRGSSQRLPTSWRCARTGAVVDVYP
jgi:hypothetical protein